ncbi:hypothetical protein [Flavicella sp.]|uniref:hypothetical protein n=1 Tax=Flavicella sp. TaxID=2957742 RepID=UPI00301B1BD5
MVKQDRNIIEQLSKTELLGNKSSKKVFNRIVLRSFNRASSSEKEKFIGALALKYHLDCADEIINAIEIKGFQISF